MSKFVTRRNLLTKIIAAAGAAIVLAIPVSARTLNKKKHHHIIIKNFEYLPAKLKVSVGDSICWTNHDIVPHTVTASDKSWDSQLIKQGDEWILDITTEIQTAYYCHYHPMMKAEFDVS